jgi:hypothetical protein
MSRAESREPYPVSPTIIGPQRGRSMEKSSLPKSKGYEKQSFFREHLRQTSIELYEWHLMLHYFWLCKGKQRAIRQVSGTPDNYGTCCKECGDAKIASGRYVLEGVIYDPKVHSFPPKNDNFPRLSIKSDCDAEFKEESKELVKEFLNEYGKDSLDFPKNAEKEFAAEYLFGNKLKSREDVEPSNRNSFHWLSIEARCLSIIYAHFSEYRERFNLEDFDLFNNIDLLKVSVLGDCHKLIGYWGLTDATKKIQAKHGQRGGKVPKAKEGILLSIIDLMKDRRKDYSATKLWNIFRKDHNGPKNKTEHLVYFKEDQTGCNEHELIEIVEDGEKPITFNTFRDYVRKAKKRFTLENC